jgi:hypothetical protein
MNQNEPFYGLTPFRPLLCFFDGLRPFLHPLLNPNPLALENRERMPAQDADGKRAIAAFHLVQAGHAKSVCRLTKDAGVSQDTGIAQNLRVFGN